MYKLKDLDVLMTSDCIFFYKDVIYDEKIIPKDMLKKFVEIKENKKKPKK